MVNRDDMLELTRRMTPARASIDRIAGAYFDEEGYVDGTFNTHFLKLSASDRGKNLELAKAVLISKTNEQLKEYRIPDESRRPGSIWQLFEGIKETGFLYPAFKDHSTDWSSSHSTIQNKFHYAITGKTAAEIVYNQADHTKENMGLRELKLKEKP